VLWQDGDNVLPDIGFDAIVFGHGFIDSVWYIDQNASFVDANLVKENWGTATDHTIRQTIDRERDIGKLEGPKSGFGCWNVSNVLRAKAGSLSISDDG
jgi:hypothetical protein